MAKTKKKRDPRFALALELLKEDCDEEEDKDCDDKDEDEEAEEDTTEGKKKKKSFALCQEELDKRGLNFMRLDASGSSMMLFDSNAQTIIPKFESQVEAKDFFVRLGVDTSSDDFFQRVVTSVRDESNSDFRPTDDDMKLISKWTKRRFDKNELKVYSTYSADTLQDRKYHHFDVLALQDMANKTAGNPFMDAHWWWGPETTYGLLFEGKVADSTVSGKYLFQRFYMLDDPEYKRIIRGFESGINCKLSVGIRIDLQYFICDLCKQSWQEGCEHWPGCRYIVAGTKEKVICTFTIKRVSEFIELSRVGVPAQPMAHVKGHADGAHVKGLHLPEAKSLIEPKGLVAPDGSPLVRKSTTAINLDGLIPNKEDSSVADDKKEEKEVPTPEAKEAKADAKADLDAFAKSLSETVAPLIATAVATEVAKQVAESTKGAEATVKGLTEVVAQLAKGLDERDANLEKSIKANRDALETTILALKNTAEKVDATTSKSLEELVSRFASIKAKDSGAPAPKTTTEDASKGIFEGIMSQFTAGKK